LSNKKYNLTVHRIIFLFHYQVAQARVSGSLKLINLYIASN